MATEGKSCYFSTDISEEGTKEPSVIDVNDPFGVCVELNEKVYFTKVYERKDGVTVHIHTVGFSSGSRFIFAACSNR